MGAASDPVRRIAFGLAWWCAVATSCSTAPEAPSTMGGETRSEDAGAAGAPAEPVENEAGAPAGKREPVSMGSGGAEDTAGGGSGIAGHPSAVRDPNGGEAAAGAPGMDPSCGKQPEGTLCGSNMSPPGPDGARYFCASGEIIAEAACPGPCDAETNACVQSGGTGGGMGDTGFGTVLRCRTCYGTLCRAELMACDADPLCTAHLACYDSCSRENVCYATCDSVFETEPLLDALNACVAMTGCADICPH